MEGKRRLPLLQSTGSEPDDGSTRPTWQWVAFGTVAIFVVWAPLAATTTSIAAHLSLGGGLTGAPPWIAAVLFAGLSSLAVAIAAFAGGFVVGKSRGARGGSREAALSGLAAAMVAIVGSWITLGFNFGSLVVAAIAVPFSTIGAKLGQPRKPPPVAARRS